MKEKEANLYFWRDTSGHEVDLIFEQNRRSVPVEIKSAMTWHTEMPDSIKKFRKKLPESHPGHLVYAGDLTPESQGNKH